MTEVQKEFQMMDTTVIQVRSVLNFMYALGYALDGTVGTGRFYTEAANMQGNRYIGVNTAIRMHNMETGEWAVVGTEENPCVVPYGIGFRNGFTPLGVRLAYASKLVKEVKLSVNRFGAIKTLDFMVHPLNEEVLKLVEPA